eukprot:UN07405
MVGSFLVSLLHISSEVTNEMLHAGNKQGNVSHRVYVSYFHIFFVG